MSISNPELPGPNRGPNDFPPTRWSVVTIAGKGTENQRRLALKELCEAYLGPVHAFIRRSFTFGSNTAGHTAEDLTQSFFLHLLEKRTLEKFERQGPPGQGVKFRSFLMVCARYFVLKALHETKREGAGIEKLSFDDWMEGPDGKDPTLAEAADPSEAMQAEWARDWMSATVQWIRKELEKADQDPGLKELIPFVFNEEKASIADLAKRLGLGESAVKMRIFRLRKEIKRLLIERVASTLKDPSESEVDEEIAFLMRYVGNGPRPSVI